MSININEAIARIRKAGGSAVRAVPMPGEDVRNGKYRIEVSDSGSWVPVLEGLPSKRSAEDIITQATNRVLLG